MILDANTLNKFTLEANKAYQQFCVWKCLDGKFTGGGYTKFWDVVVPSLGHAWILAVARLNDRAHFCVRGKIISSQLSINYIVELLNDRETEKIIKTKLRRHKDFTKSIKDARNNFIAHRPISFGSVKIKPDVEDFFQDLETIIEDIKVSRADLKNCNAIDLNYTENLLKESVDRVL